MPVNMCVPGQVYGAVSVVFGLSAVRTMEAHSLSSADLRWMTAVSPARRSVPQGAFPPFRQLICHLLYEVIAIRMKQARGHRDGERERERERDRGVGLVMMILAAGAVHATAHLEPSAESPAVRGPRRSQRGLNWHPQPFSLVYLFFFFSFFF